MVPMSCWWVILCASIGHVGCFNRPPYISHRPAFSKLKSPLFYQLHMHSSYVRVPVTYVFQLCICSSYVCVPLMYAFQLRMCSSYVCVPVTYVFQLCMCSSYVCVPIMYAFQLCMRSSYVCLKLSWVEGPDDSRSLGCVYVNPWSVIPLYLPSHCTSIVLYLPSHCTSIVLYLPSHCTSIVLYPDPLHSSRWITSPLHEVAVM